MRAGVVLAVVCFASLAAAEPARFELSVSPRRVTTNDFVTATVTLELPGVKGAARYWPPKFKGFRIVDQQFIPSTSVRGQDLITTELRRYTLQPLRAGNFYFDPARVRVDGKISETKGAYVVVAGVARPLDTTAGSWRGTAPPGLDVPGYRPPTLAKADMFLDVVADTKRPVVGEQVTVTWLLYTRTEVLKFEPRLPRWRSLWTEVISEPTSFLQYHDIALGGRAYQVAIVSKRAVFPTRAGTVKLPPFKARVVALGAELGRPKPLASPPLTLKVGRLPRPKPAGFDGSYFGRYTASATVDRNEIRAGESVTLELTVRGAGPIRRTSPPAVGNEHFDVVPAASFDEQVTFDAGVAGGIRVYRYLVTPKRGGSQVFPPIEVAYFDPSSKTYGVAATEPIPILVAGQPVKTATDDGRPRRPVRDIRVIATGPAPDRLLVRPYERLWWILLFALPPLAYAGAVVIDGLRQRMRKETPRSRRRRARGRANKRFRTAEIHIRGNRPQQFYGELARCITEHLDDRFEGRGVASMTRAELRELLAGAGLTRGLIETIERELDTCDAARFAEGDATADEMRNALGRVQSLMARLERLNMEDEA